MPPGPGCGLLQDGAAPCAPASSAVIDRSSEVLKSRRQSRCFPAGNGPHGRSAIGEIARLECSGSGSTEIQIIRPTPDVGAYGPTVSCMAAISTKGIPGHDH